MHTLESHSLIRYLPKRIDDVVKQIPVIGMQSHAIAQAQSTLLALSQAALSHHPFLRYLGRLSNPTPRCEQKKVVHKKKKNKSQRRAGLCAYVCSVVIFLAVVHTDMVDR